MHPLTLSAADLRVLKLIQKNCDTSRQHLSDAAGMSSSTLWRRLTDLETSGAIRKRVALLDPNLVGVPVCVFLSVNLVNYDVSIRKDFESYVNETPEIMECFAITGSFDYMLIVRTKDVMTFERFLTDKILTHASVASASSQMSLRQQKYSTELPL